MQVFGIEATFFENLIDASLALFLRVHTAMLASFHTVPSPRRLSHHDSQTRCVHRKRQPRGYSSAVGASRVFRGVRRHEGHQAHGRLTMIEWTNPHSCFYVDVDEDDSPIVHWISEAGSPSALSRQGFKRGGLTLGDTIVVDGYRAKGWVALD